MTARKDPNHPMSRQARGLLGAIATRKILTHEDYQRNGAKGAATKTHEDYVSMGQAGSKEDKERAGALGGKASIALMQQRGTWLESCRTGGIRQCHERWHNPAWGRGGVKTFNPKCAICLRELGEMKRIGTDSGTKEQ